jgi:hypothetical protein
VIPDIAVSLSRENTEHVGVSMCRSGTEFEDSAWLETLGMAVVDDGSASPDCGDIREPSGESEAVSLKGRSAA